MRKTVFWKYVPQGIALLSVIYVAVRIFTIDITNDEAYSFHNVKEFWYAEFLCTGNSHWLNSLWMWLCTIVGLEQVPVLRLLSFSSFLVFAYYTLKFSNNFDHPVKLLSVCLLLLNPYALDYFVLARGYASGMMFGFVSLYFFLKAVDQPSRKMEIIALLCACLAAISNYSFLYYLLPFSGVYFYYFHLKSHPKFFLRKKLYADLFLFLVTLSLVFFAIRFITRCSNDYVGAGAETITATVRGFMSPFFSEKYLSDDLWGTLILLFCGQILIVSVLIGIFKKKRNASFFYTSVIIAGSVVVIYAGKSWLNGVFPEGRSALFLFPLIIVNLVWLLKEIHIPYKKFILYPLSTLLIFNFGVNINFSFTEDFKAQGNTKEVFHYLDSLGAKNVLLDGDIYGVYKNYYSLKNNTPFTFQAQKAIVADGKLKVDVDNDYLIIGQQKLPLLTETDSVTKVSLHAFSNNSLIMCKLTR